MSSVIEKQQQKNFKTKQRHWDINHGCDHGDFIATQKNSFPQIVHPRNYCLWMRTIKFLSFTKRKH